MCQFDWIWNTRNDVGGVDRGLLQNTDDPPLNVMVGLQDNLYEVKSAFAGEHYSVRLYVISGFCRRVNEIRALLWFYAAYTGGCFYRNVSKKLPFYAA